MAHSHRTASFACLAVVLAGGAVAGCGSSSDKPAYCDNVSALKKSVTDFSVSEGISGIQSQLTTIQSEAKTTVASARSDFPAQSTALNTSITNTVTAVNQLGSSPSAKDIASLIPVAASVKTAGTQFVDAVAEKCG